MLQPPLTSLHPSFQTFLCFLLSLLTFFLLSGIASSHHISLWQIHIHPPLIPPPPPPPAGFSNQPCGKATTPPTDYCIYRRSAGNKSEPLSACLPDQPTLSPALPGKPRSSFPRALRSSSCTIARRSFYLTSIKTNIKTSIKISIRDPPSKSSLELNSLSSYSSLYRTCLIWQSEASTALPPLLLHLVSLILPDTTVVYHIELMYEFPNKFVSN